MESFRCPTCIGLLADPTARRCPHCGQNVRRKRPRVLGEEGRIGSTLLPVDRWMIERLDTESPRRGRKSLPPVAWHGRFTTTPLAEPDFSATPSPLATPLAPPTILEPAAAAPVAPAVAFPEPEAPATVGALALDVYTRPLPVEDVLEDEFEVATATAIPVPVEAPDRSDVADVPDVATLPQPLAPEPFSVPPAPPAGKPTPHEELEPDVRALVDELYEQARAELSGNDLGFFMPTPDETIVDEPPSDSVITTPMFDEPMPPARFAEPAAPPVVAQTQPLYAEPERPVVAPAPEVEAPRTGWVPAIQAEPRRRGGRAAE